MDAKNTPATQIVDSLRPEDIERRLDAISREEKALRVLLRAARARHAVARYGRGSQADQEGRP